MAERTPTELLRAAADKLERLIPLLVAWLRSAADDAELIGPDRHALRLARALLGEEEQRDG